MNYSDIADSYGLFFILVFALFIVLGYFAFK